MNLNKNDRCENFDLDDDPDIFEFYMDFVREIDVAVETLEDLMQQVQDFFLSETKRQN